MEVRRSEVRWNSKKIHDYRRDRLICVRIAIAMLSLEATLIILGIIGDMVTAVYGAMITQLLVSMTLMYVLVLSVEIRSLEKYNKRMKEL